MVSGNTGFGIILRDSYGATLLCYSSFIGGKFDSNVAEGLCLKEALSWICDQGSTVLSWNQILRC